MFTKLNDNETVDTRDKIIRNYCAPAGEWRDRSGKWKGRKERDSVRFTAR